MFIDKHRFYISTGDTCKEYPPTLYIDWYKLKGNLKRNWRVHTTFHFSIGAFGKEFTLELYWNFQERERTEREEEQYQKTLQLIEVLSK
tara:strand:+ start:171 stop:437 length:267 start_codon:yes stop_codon:yes gene_type:complete